MQPILEYILGVVGLGLIVLAILILETQPPRSFSRVSVSSLLVGIAGALLISQALVESGSDRWGIYAAAVSLVAGIALDVRLWRRIATLRFVDRHPLESGFK